MSLVLAQYIPENSAAFQNKVVEISKKLGINPNWLMVVMYSESRFNHRIINSLGCVGLIQFCPNGGLSLFGLNSAQMASLSNVQQLDYVYKYFEPVRGQIKSLSDLYIYNLTPASFGYRNNPNHILGSTVSQEFARAVASQNKPFDYNNNGLITVQDVRNYLNKKYGAILGKTQNSNSNNLTLALIIISIFLFKDELNLDF